MQYSARFYFTDSERKSRKHLVACSRGRAQFGLGPAPAQCSLPTNQVDPRRIWEFQIAEVQVPGRGRGRDYRLGIEDMRF